MRKNKILVILTYYERPKLVRNALYSILEANKYYEDWMLFFFDDGSKTPGKPIVEEILADHLDKVRFYNSNQTPEEKLIEGWNVAGLITNVLEYGDEPDIVVILEDDNEIFPSYFYNLNSHFNENENCHLCYSNINIYNPLYEKSSEISNMVGKFNQLTEPIEAIGALEISQLALSWEAIQNAGLAIAHMDISPVALSSEVQVTTGIASTLLALKSFGKKIFTDHGPATYTGFVSQYKGSHSKEAVYRHHNIESLFLNKSMIDSD